MSINYLVTTSQVVYLSFFISYHHISEGHHLHTTIGSVGGEPEFCDKKTISDCDCATCQILCCSVFSGTGMDTRSETFPISNDS